ncbi:ammonia channel protein, partial [Duganella callida]
MKKTITSLLAGVSILFALAAPVQAQDAKPADAPAAAASTPAASAPAEAPAA